MLMKLAKESTLGEEIFNAITHGVGAILSIVALVLLLIKAESLKETIVVTIFSLSSLMLYLMSTLFHSFPKGTTKNVFQRFDHLAIYLMIAGHIHHFPCYYLNLQQLILYSLFNGF